MTNTTNGVGASTSIRTAGGRLARKRPAWERADLAAQAYVQKLPIEVSTPQQRRIENPTLAQLAIAYGVTVADIQRRLNGGHQVPPDGAFLRTSSDGRAS